MEVPSLNDLAVDGTLNTTNQPTKPTKFDDRWYDDALNSNFCTSWTDQPQENEGFDVIEQTTVLTAQAHFKV